MNYRTRLTIKVTLAFLLVSALLLTIMYYRDETAFDLLFGASCAFYGQFLFYRRDF